MTNKEFLRKASKLQKEFAELYEDDTAGLEGISNDYIQVMAKKFHELEKEGLLEHVSTERTGEDNYLRYQAMTPQGVKVIALEFVSEIEDKR